MIVDWTPPATNLDDERSVYGELLDLIARRPSWHAQAACHGQTHLMFPENNLDGNEGRRVCAGCPVQEQCDAQATANEEVYGTWGGVSERRRRRNVAIVRRQARDSRRGAA